ncbi:hypothetical protein [Acuticoccus mangrovi]|uniref:Uncharacterized protein n=1 Tax=Acuticoccus mangrovi TaxID=2796142 RepID=A0A934IU15_9HYPH|nr:hypothetical protein [Acuticoccus mangrovi]MBJ3778745.1 hypothetical protein [Acuticoccus mangrovi]
MRPLLAACVLSIGLALVATAARANDAVVLDGIASAGNLQAGSIIATADPLHLSAGERLTILLQSGDVVTVVGPHDGPVPRPGEASGDLGGALQTVADVVVGVSGTSRVVGASREVAIADPAGDTPHGVWLIDLAEGGTHCALDGARFLRHEVGRAALVTIESAAGTVGPLSWGADAATLSLPASMVADGPMTVTLDGVPHNLVLKRVPDGVDDAAPGALLAFFATAGCRGQVRQMLAILAAD